MKKIVFVFSMALPFYANAWEPCGTDALGNTANCEYQIDASGTLTIRGTGNNGNIGYWYSSAQGDVIQPWKNKSVTNVVIEDTIKDLGSYGLWNITSINPVEIPSSITTISNNAFYGVLTSEVIIPNSVTEIEDSAFNWSSIERITIPDSVENIGACLRGAVNLKNLIIPDSITYLPKEILSYTELETLTISDNTTLGEIFTGNGEETYVNFSNLKIYCTGDTAKCDANLAAAGYPDLKSSKATTKKINGVTYIYDKSGKLVTSSGHRSEKRIYTIEEANAVAGARNRVSIKYR